MIATVREYCSEIERQELNLQEELNRIENNANRQKGEINERKIILDKLAAIRREVDEIANNTKFFNLNRTINLRTEEEALDINKYKALKKKLKNQNKEKERLIGSAYSLCLLLF